MQTTHSRGLSKAEFEALKGAATAELGSIVSLRYHTEKYCKGAVDISARGKRAQFTAEQFEKARSFVVAHGLFKQGQDILLGENGHYCHLTGVNFLTRII